MELLTDEEIAEGWRTGKLPARKAPFVFTPEQFADADEYLARVVGLMCLQYRDFSECVPHSLETDEWHRILTRIGSPLLDYANRVRETETSDEEMALRRKARQAMELFSHWFDQMWEG